MTLFVPSIAAAPSPLPNPSPQPLSRKRESGSNWNSGLLHAAVNDLSPLHRFFVKPWETANGIALVLERVECGAVVFAPEGCLVVGAG
jgi:hypothetical protein